MSKCSIRTLLPVCLIVLAGCASKSTSIAPSYVSPTAYKNYDCDALTVEYARVIQESQKVNNQQDDIASNDKTSVAVGMIIWPALFFIEGDDVEEVVATLKGELIAVEQASILKKCETLSIQIESDRILSKKALEEN